MDCRLAAILAANVVGYSRLMGADETGTLERLKALRKELVQPKITGRNGRIVKLMGDGLLADRHELDGETVKASAGIRRQAGIFRIGDHGEQRLDMRHADPGDNPDGSRPGYGELEVKHDFDADAGDLICMKTGGIHAVRNRTDGVTLSLHTYGKHINYTNRSQFDPDIKEKKDFIVRVE
ncbi:MAG: hypothetical protein OEM59_19200 [Rhodospirillales bacterium]|nr:hypothetical protein [Rhodospirillales bacterium]